MSSSAGLTLACRSCNTILRALTGNAIVSYSTGTEAAKSVQHPFEPGGVLITFFGPGASHNHCKQRAWGDDEEQTQGVNE